MLEPTIDEDFIGGEPTLETVRFAGFGVRLAATLIDVLALSPIWGLGVYNSLEIKSLPLMIGLTILSTLYKPYLEWKEGATLGKMVKKIKVVNKDLQPITGEQSFHRYALWLGSVIISTAINIQLYTAPEFPDLTTFVELGEFSQDSPLNSINSFYDLFFIVAVCSFVIDERKQGLHDKLARTYCIHR